MTFQFYIFINFFFKWKKGKIISIENINLNEKEWIFFLMSYDVIKYSIIFIEGVEKYRKTNKMWENTSWSLIDVILWIFYFCTLI